MILAFAVSCHKTPFRVGKCDEDGMMYILVELFSVVIHMPLISS